MRNNNYTCETKHQGNKNFYAPKNPDGQVVYTWEKNSDKKV